MQLTFVVTANDYATLHANLLASPCLQAGSGHTLIVQEGFDSAAGAYNEALERAATENIVFVHQDVFLPKSWVSELEESLAILATTDPEWGVLGCWGVTEAGAGKGYVYTPGQEVIGCPFKAPERVQTLDELLLIVRKSSAVRFSTTLPGFHFYGTDICMSAAARGLHSYAISAFCVHNACQYLFFPQDFYSSYKQIKRLWKDRLPISTSCIRISRFDTDYWVRRVRETYFRVTTRNPDRLPRSKDPQLIAASLGR